jgi:hypothetical protein
MTCIFFIIDYKYKDDGGMKKGLNRFAGLKFYGGKVELFSSLMKGSKRFNRFNGFKRLEIQTP